jgi:hypothetical protein
MEWPWDVIRCLLSLVCGIVSLILGIKLEFEKDRPMLYAPWWVMKSLGRYEMKILRWELDSNFIRDIRHCATKHLCLSSIPLETQDWMKSGCDEASYWLHLKASDDKSVSQSEPNLISTYSPHALQCINRKCSSSPNRVS